jgi:hypothetical protein
MMNGKMNDKIKSLALQSGVVESHVDWQAAGGGLLEKFAELIIEEHLSIWERMDNGNKVAGYVEMEDYPKAILKHFGVE